MTDPADEALLTERWSGAWRSLALTPADGLDPLLAELRVAYQRPPRAYHTLTHVADCLRELAPVRAKLRQPALVELALFFHDAVYEPLARENEARSAALARRVLAGAGAPLALLDEVERLILATAHQPSGAAREPDDDAATVVDVDLSILGRDSRTYDRFELGVRAEYAVVPEDLFRRGRAALLRGFLERSAIYATPHFRARYEARARENLGRALAALGA